MNLTQHNDPQPGTPEPLLRTEDAAERGEDKAETSTPAIEFQNVSFSYEDKQVLHDLSFKVAKGEIKIILSASGGGKSTILKLVVFECRLQRHNLI